jgi:hypothetical protein
MGRLTLNAKKPEKLTSQVYYQISNYCHPILARHICYALRNIIKII